MRKCSYKNQGPNVEQCHGIIGKLEGELTELRKCKEALEAMRKCPLIIEAGFVPYIESVLGLRDDYAIRKKDGTD